MPIVTYTNSNTGTIVDCFPVAGSLANWATQKVRLTEGTAPNTGRWTGDLFAGNWAVFEGGTTPSSFSASVGTFFVEAISDSQITLLDPACGEGVNLSHTSLVRDFTIFQGAYWESVPISFVDTAGVYVDLSQVVFRGQARRDLGPSTGIAYSFTFTVSIADPNKHTVVVSLAATTTDALTVGKTVKDKDSIFYYDWEMVDTLGRPHRFMKGRNFIDRNATR
jgi:hypothetical protein